ncbi:reverse transcriptase [Gossypium australe]|uniref:Reverse transcriptase n=1 Tax=Gossypium australe TaxID=47621 RepID=A0A5B6X640_9ROSI|nr:reverse transcriptase [Gossypium australe]
MVGQRKTWAFANFADWFKKRVEEWSLRICQLGATPLYAMQCILLPKSLCRKLEGIMNRFWWTNNKTLKGIH